MKKAVVDLSLPLPVRTRKQPCVENPEGVSAQSMRSSPFPGAACSTTARYRVDMSPQLRCCFPPPSVVINNARRRSTLLPLRAFACLPPNPQ